MRLISIISKDTTQGKYSICKKKRYVDWYYFAKLEMHYQLMNAQLNNWNAVRNKGFKWIVDINCLGYRRICLDILVAKLKL